jgi:hypothetical protein
VPRKTGVAFKMMRSVWAAALVVMGKIPVGQFELTTSMHHKSRKLQIESMT